MKTEYRIHSHPNSSQIDIAFVRSQTHADGTLEIGNKDILRLQAGRVLGSPNVRNAANAFSQHRAVVLGGPMPEKYFFVHDKSHEILDAVMKKLDEFYGKASILTIYAASTAFNASAYGATGWLIGKVFGTALMGPLGTAIGIVGGLFKGKELHQELSQEKHEFMLLESVLVLICRCQIGDITTEEVAQEIAALTPLCSSREKTSYKVAFDELSRIMTRRHPDLPQMIDNKIQINEAFASLGFGE